MVIKRSTAINVLLKFQIICCLFEEIIYSYFPNAGAIFLLPQLISIIYIFFLLQSFFENNSRIVIGKDNLSFIFLSIFLIYILLSVFWSSFNIYNIVSRLQHILLGSITYCVVRKYLTHDSYTWIINFISITQIFNMILTIYQNIVMKKHPDFCNGIFGFIGYNNGAQGCFCIAVSLLAFAYYIDGTWKPLRCFMLIGMSCVICAFAEIKVYFVVFIIGAITFVAIRKNTLKEKMKILIAGLAIVILLYIAYQILLVVLPDNLYTFFSINGYLSYDGRSDYAGRTNAISFIYKNSFDNNFFKSLFGTGLGSSSSDYIYELGKSFSEFGFIGLGLLGLFLISIFWYYFNPKRKNVRTQEQCYCAVYAGVYLVAMVVWNCTFNRYVFLNFFFLAISNVQWIERKRSYHLFKRRISYSKNFEVT